MKDSASSKAADVAALTRLAGLLNSKPRKRSRGSIAKLLPRRTIRRDAVAVAKRYLRWFIKGDWHSGSYHVGRLNFGPAICFDTRLKVAFLDRCK